MRSTRILTIGVAFALLVGSVLGGSTPARAATPILQFSAPGGLVCGSSSITISYTEVRDYPATGMSVVERGLIDDGLVEGPIMGTPPGPPNNVGSFPARPTYLFSDRPGTSFTYKREWSLYQGTTLASRSTLVISCYWNGSSYFSPILTVINEDYGDSLPAQPFSGPALPGPDARNLVLFNTDTAALSAPSGAFTGQILRACQTAFVTATSDDGEWGQLFVMGGWVPMANTRDVPEDYGQPGSPIAPDCLGK